jgi:survival of motor neuron protein-interacting protein 1
MADNAAAAADSAARTRYARGQLEALRAAPSEEAQARLWAEVSAALAAAGFSGEYDGLMDAEDPSIRKPGRKGKKAAGGGWKRHDAAAATQFLGTAPFLFPSINLAAITITRSISGQFTVSRVLVAIL